MVTSHSTLREDINFVLVLLKQWILKRNEIFEFIKLYKATVNNNRPMTCIPMMRKVLTILIAEIIYECVDSAGLSREDQKFWRRNKKKQE